MAKFTLDINANLDDLTADLKTAQGDLSKLGDEAIATGKETQVAFNQAGEGVEKLQRSLRDQFLFYGKTEIQIRKLKAALKSTFDPAVVADLKKQLKETTEQVVSFAAAANKAETASRSLRTQIRENTQILAEMEDQGLETTDAFFQLQVQTGKLRDQMNDTNERIKFFASDTRGIDGLIAVTRVATAGFSVAQGAAALFGAENENVQKALLKVNAAMAILNGLQEIQQGIQKSSAARLTIELALSKIKIFFLGAETAATEGLTAAQIKAAASAKILRAALITTGIGAIIALLVVAANAMGVFSESTEEATERIKKQNEAIAEHLEFLNQEADKLAIIKQRREGGINDQKRELEILKAKGASSKEIFDLEQEIRKKEKDELNTRLGFLSGNAAAERDIKEQIKDKANEILAAETAYFKQQADEKIKKSQELSAKLRGIEDANTANRIAAMQDGFPKEMAQLEENHRKELIEARKQGLNITLLKSRFEAERIALTEKFAKQGRDFADAETTRQNKERKEAQAKAIQDQLDFIDQVEKLQLLELDIEFESGKKSIAEAKRIAQEKLEVEIKAAKDRLALINPNSVEGKQLELAIIEAQNKIKELGKRGNTLLDALGLGEISPEDLEDLKGKIKIIGDSIKSILDDIVGQAMDKNDKLIEGLDKQIDKVKDNIEKQKKLQEEGESNNLEAEQATLAKLEEQRRAAFERDKKLQKEKLAADAASQLSSLITASAKIFEAYASLPFVGQALSIAAIAAMFGAFAISQVRARQSINQQTFKHGGEVKGKRHNADGWGGERFVSDRGNETYIEQGEWITNRQSAKKYRKWLEAINNDNLKSLLQGTGVSLDPQKVNGYKELKQSYANSEIRHRIEMENEGFNKGIEALRRDFNQKMKDMADKPKISYENGYRIEIRGNRIIRTKLK